MKEYTVSVEIDLPREKVIELFDNPDNLAMWQEGFQSFTHLEGEPGQPGAKSLIVYENNGQRVELTETILERNLPDQFDGVYSWGGGSNTLLNRFIEVGPDRTRWESTCSYEFKTLFLKLMGFFMPGAFKKQNQKFLDAFKAFCEKGRDVREELV